MNFAQDNLSLWMVAGAYFSFKLEYGNNLILFICSNPLIFLRFIKQRKRNIVIPYSTQNINDEDVQAVVDQLRAPWLTQGPTVEAFGAALAEYCGSKYGIAVSNGTAALHLSLMALGIGPDALVWTTPNSFAASANCARYVGADVDFVDIDPKTFCMSVEALEIKLAVARKAGRLPDALIPVHHSGLSCDMVSMRRLSSEYDFKIVEDACHALGGSYQGHKIGNCEFSELTVSSFHPVKNITTGEGGAVFTNCKATARKIILLRSHGITRNEDMMEFPDETPWHYEQVELGYNYRITDIQCALGLSQLKRLDSWTKSRSNLAQRYDEMFESSPFAVQESMDGAVSARHLYVIRVPDNKRDAVGKALRKLDIFANVHYEPIHLHPYYRQLGFEVGSFPEAEAYGKDALSIPLYPELTFEQQEYVFNSIVKAYEEA